MYRSYEECSLYGFFFYHFLSYSFGSILNHCIYGCMFCIFMFNFVNYVFLLLCLCILIVMYVPFCVLCLCCSVYRLCVHVFCTTDTAFQPNCSSRIYHIIYHIISYHIISYHIISYHIISYHIISYHIISYHIISYRIVSYRIVSYRIISYHIISYHIISYHISYHIIYHIISYIISYHISHCSSLDNSEYFFANMQNFLDNTSLLIVTNKLAILNLFLEQSDMDFYKFVFFSFKKNFIS